MQQPPPRVANTAPSQPDLPQTASTLISSEEGVNGILCADARGLCLAAKGCSQAHMAGYLRSIVDNAVDLLGAPSSEHCIVCVESASGKILLTGQQQTYTAIFKTAAP
eukprot:gnl/Spiro4/14420_TR7768_c0_g1_i4.p2 gnl/Spiro4/14420_TR7768_c0_g1~~gnl/Spiro4/14420_TR7768_c0_g1_i4.p2  ORF type:complete len:126 (-),score=20.70 gnl/Spiro4/14420_TR7768_c0_g1_i4:69-392(-)